MMAPHAGVMSGWMGSPSALDARETASGRKSHGASALAQAKTA